MVRVKNRYLVLQITQQDQKETISKLQFRANSLYEAIMSKLQQLHGDFGVGSCKGGFTAKYCNEYTGTAVVRARHGPHRLVASSIPFIRIIEGKVVIVNILYVGATIRQCFKFLKNYQQKKFDEYYVTLKDEDERKALRQSILNLGTVLDKL
ncbi:unnamed protein product [Callosobruchus maculatus]|uniref:Ribonuclease P/MRP protein subunit POP5 n=1 Tax=Callosobruchus maculatus TaxID=64391 RepID=A0A653CR81_CALMS|nr:unnamed protein product [Callosobruchus maculatus]